MSLYLLNGFSRSDHQKHVRIIVNADDELFGDNSPLNVASRIAGPDYCFPLSTPISDRIAIHGEAIGILFHSDAELEVAEPDLYRRMVFCPPRLKRRRRAP
jgi:hypothetical protein